ncbi:hypothetical protein COE15_11530 [Bacillus cereus]|nr:hypothetical protein CN288_14615 [Bacillus sp. AFS023182]PGY01122.1 hypothetical protein COE15_11530 [Bacillus cereus]SDY71327.1 hypothetical protein SAMN04488156_1028 [Bacillus sp. 166amftsu]
MPPISIQNRRHQSFIGAYQKRLSLLDPTIEVPSYSEKRKLKASQITALSYAKKPSIVCFRK